VAASALHATCNATCTATCTPPARHLHTHAPPPHRHRPPLPHRHPTAPATSRTSAAETSDIKWDSSEPGITPFISFVHLVGQSLSAVRTVSFEIEPKPDSVSAPVRVTYTLESLRSRGRLTSDLLVLPVFGLYAGFANPVSIDLTFDDGSMQTIDSTLTTAAYTDPNGVYDHPVFIERREAGSELGFDFFALKSDLGTPVIIDTDGTIRWVGVSSEGSIPSVFTDNGFVIGDRHSTGCGGWSWMARIRWYPWRFPTTGISITTSTPARWACWASSTRHTDSKARLPNSPCQVAFSKSGISPPSCATT
jgi:hypothetical protein